MRHLGIILSVLLFVQFPNAQVVYSGVYCSIGTGLHLIYSKDQFLRLMEESGIDKPLFSHNYYSKQVPILDLNVDYFFNKNHGLGLHFSNAYSIKFSGGGPGYMNFDFKSSLLTLSPIYVFKTKNQRHLFKAGFSYGLHSIKSEIYNLNNFNAQESHVLSSTKRSVVLGGLLSYHVVVVNKDSFFMNFNLKWRPMESGELEPIQAEYVHAVTNELYQVRTNQGSINFSSLTIGAEIGIKLINK
jgi:hypothetical protein